MTYHLSVRGEGQCGKCKVIIKKGWENTEKPTQAELKLFSQEQIEEHYRLACQIIIRGPLIVEVPMMSRIGRQKLQTKGMKVTVPLKPFVKKYLLEMRMPRLEDQRADEDRILDSLKEKGVDAPLLEYETLKKLPSLIRESG